MGLTLFEVLLALAIFMGAMVVLGQLLSTGVRGALRAKLETEAIFRAESKLGEITAGALPFEAVSSQEEVDSDEWRYSVAIEQGPSDQLFVVTVTSTHPGRTTSSDVSYSLSRLVRDPQLLLDAATAEAQAAEEGTSSSSSTSPP
jgi:type II secretion system protein I